MRMYRKRLPDWAEREAERPMIKDKDGNWVHCTAFCPLCGSDLVFQDNECICKNKDCGWHCGGCKTEDDV